MLVVSHFGSHKAEVDTKHQPDTTCCYDGFIISSYWKKLKWNCEDVILLLPKLSFLGLLFCSLAMIILRSVCYFWQFLTKQCWFTWHLYFFYLMVCFASCIYRVWLKIAPAALCLQLLHSHHQKMCCSFLCYLFWVGSSVQVTLSSENIDLYLNLSKAKLIYYW